MSLLFPVQPHPEVGAIFESDTGAADNSGPDVPAVQAECPPGGQQLHPTHNGDYHPATGSHTQV